MMLCHDDLVTISSNLDPVRAEIDSLIQRMVAGERIDRSHENKHVDLKEEPGRRGPGGSILPGYAESSAAAKQLAAEAACMANTPGGGGLIVGVADDGTLIGTQLDAEWLRHRIYEHSGRLLTADVIPVEVGGVRLLLIIAPEAVEPIRIDKKITWRVKDNCVEVDASTWHARRMYSLNYDWSYAPSTQGIEDARPQALNVARDFLLASGDPQANDLANATDAQLLRRLNVVSDDGMLTNAGVLGFIGRGTPCLDYQHREYAGGDSTARVRRPDRSLLEELAEVFSTMEARNSTRHVQAGLVVRQVREIPALAAREAVVNGVAHREWGQTDPTVVEHIGRTLRVTSPGGFFGGVNESNIITHPSRSRNPSLTQLLADLRVAEREGIGVDRMVREMVKVGHQPPAIREISGPSVRASLVGDALDESWMAWLSAISPPEESNDVSSLLLLHHLVAVGWVDEVRAVPLIQLPVEESRGAISKLSQATIQKKPLLVKVAGTPEGSPAAWRLGVEALHLLAEADEQRGHHRTTISRAEIAKSYAEHRGRISTTELGSLVNASPSNVGDVLKRLVVEGELEPSNQTGMGRGFFYRWIGTGTRAES